MKPLVHNSSCYLCLDKSVWLVMFVLIIISLGLMGYRKATYEPCVEFTIFSKGFSENTNNQFTVGDDIRFTVSRRDGKNIVWNFGDSIEEKGTTVITHNYNRDGRFDVTATINGKCQSITTVYIRKPNVNRNYTEQNNSPALITGSDAPEVNKPAIYMTNTTAESYEWSVLNRNEYKNQTGKFAAFNFKTEGRYTLQLKLDNDRQKIFTKEIFVKPSTAIVNNNNPLPTRRLNLDRLPRREENEATSPVSQPVNPTAQPPIVPPTTEDASGSAGNHYIDGTDKFFFKSFEEVIRGGKPITDFDKYLCNGTGTRVLLNDKNYMSFEQFFNTIKGNNKRKINKVELVKENKCIIIIKASVSKKNFIGAWVDL
jgi:hypothetical protein